MKKKTTFTGLSNATAAEKIHAFFGITVEMQRRIGTFVVAWGMFEVNCEPLVWTLRNEDPKDKIPSTDRRPISELLISMHKWSEDEPSHKFSQQVALLSTVADDLLYYRNAIIHGRAFPGPSFVSNAPIFGELRKRDSSTAHVSEQLLDMAAEAANILIKSLGGITAYFSQDISLSPNFIPTMTASLQRAQSLASEIRHLEKFVNDEKY
jgi:hypothetical protein